MKSSNNSRNNLSDKETQASIAMLIIAAMGQRDIEQGRIQPAKEVFRELFEKIGHEDSE